MSAPRRVRPPRLAEALLARRASPEFGEFELGDLAQEYTARRAAAGPVAAWVWYWGQALRMLQGGGKRSLVDRLGSAFGGLGRDLRDTARSMRHNPGFTLAVVGTLALGIGANTAMFSVIDATLLRPFDFPDADRVVYVSAQRLEDDRSRNPTVEELLYWAERADAFERVEAYDAYSVPYATDEGAIWMLLHRTTPGYLAAMGLEPITGRLLLPDDARPDAVPVTVLGEGVWQAHFASDPAVLDAAVTLEGTVYTVVGVVPDRPGWNDRFYVSLPTSGSAARNAYVRGIAWLDQDVSVDAARARLQGMPLADTDGVRWEAKLDRPSNVFWGVDEVRVALLSLMGTVFLVLAIACVNVANLMLSRGAARGGEMALRSALGASRMRLARLLLIESLGLATLGGVLGLVVAWGSLAVLKTQDPGFNQFRERLAAVHIDAFVLGYATLIAVVTGVAFGLVPAWKAASVPHRRMLQRSDGRSASGRGRGVLVAAETALGVVLLIAAGLVSRAFLEIRFAHPGFDAERILSVRLDLPDDRYPTPEHEAAFFDELLARAERLPGVEQVGIGYGAVPPSELGTRGELELASGEVVDERFFTSVTFAGPEYFDLMGIALLRGRPFEAADVQDGGAFVDRPVVVSRPLARYLQPEGDVMGLRFRIRGFRDDRWSRVVGVAGDVSGRDVLSPDCECGWQIYLPLEPGRRYTEVLLRLVDGTEPPLAGLRRAINELDPLVPSNDELETAAAGLRRYHGQSSFRALLFGSFAAIAVGLAALGIFGVVAYTVTQRTREMGVRLALGARPEQVRRLAVSQGMVPVIAGIILGVAGGLAAARLMAGLLYAVSPTDPLTIAITVAMFAAVATLATWIPASRATRVDPIIALRSE